jgi:hypothetical protein
VWSELRERVAQYDSRTSDMRLGGGGVSPSVEARNFTDRGGEAADADLVSPSA